MYELVKNAFDAGSRRVVIEVVVRLKYTDIERLRERLIERLDKRRFSVADNTADRLAMEEFRQEFLDAVDLTAPDARVFQHTVEHAATWDILTDTLTEANYIVVSDTGEGMTLDTLEDAFLTIGTRSRHAVLQSRRANGNLRPILGEKGVGRLSTMRLGERLHIESTTSGEAHWNVLDIDWSLLSHDSDELLEAFPVDARRGRQKDDPAFSGTHIRISSLNAEWTVEKLESFARKEFSRLTDPFAAKTVFPISLHFNGELVSIQRFDKLLLKHAHATVRAQFKGEPDGMMRLTGTVQYKERQRTFALEGTHLASTTDSSPYILNSLGPFSIEVYWYNRKVLTEIEGIGNRREVLALVNTWGGGVMVFRDGFRVLPYGGPDDDWLGLDRKAFGSGGYKVNRAQIIGRLSISSRDNPALTDQTNREGLRDCPEKGALMKLLLYVVRTELKTFLDTVDKDIQAREPVAIEELEQRVRSEGQRVEDNLVELARRVPEIQQHQPLLKGIREALAQIDNLIQDVQEVASSYEEGRGQLLHLAGIGLTVEMLAHELNRATEYALITLGDASSKQMPQPVGALIQTLEAQLKTLQKRLRLLDPLSTAARQRKETFDVVVLVQDVVDAHADRFAREGITCMVVTEPSNGRPQLRIKAVKGMIIQVVENLVANSVYWLRQQRTLDPMHRSQIQVTVDTAAQEIRVWDNGPGVPYELRERVFEAFFSTKPAGEGKGLGLFIGREIARYHGADLYLAEKPSGPDKTLHTFILTLGGMAT
ncbi:MAG: ATP-binding protein [Chloroflexi bacterium]|nr:ATP-binding protein [Chloroflexota bacterium]MCI0647177.1 ATP-binding protein [Chloroflexota bacterium]